MFALLKIIISIIRSVYAPSRIASLRLFPDVLHPLVAVLVCGLFMQAQVHMRHAKLSRTLLRINLHTNEFRGEHTRQPVPQKWGQMREDGKKNNTAKGQLETKLTARRWSGREVEATENNYRERLLLV